MANLSKFKKKIQWTNNIKNVVIYLTLSNKKNVNNSKNNFKIKTYILWVQFKCLRPTWFSQNFRIQTVFKKLITIIF